MGCVAVTVRLPLSATVGHLINAVRLESGISGDVKVTVASVSDSLYFRLLSPSTRYVVACWD